MQMGPDAEGSDAKGSMRKGRWVGASGPRSMYRERQEPLSQEPAGEGGAIGEVGVGVGAERRCMVWTVRAVAAAAAATLQKDPVAVAGSTPIRPTAVSTRN